MSDNKPSTQQAILLAAIDCINQYGIEQVTTRMIAEAAGANIASINYYYRTKDHLIDEALKMTIHHMMEDVQITLEDKNLSFREMLNEVLFYIIDGSNHNRGISTAHLYSLVVEKNYQSITGRVFSDTFEQLLKRAAEAFPDHPKANLRLLLASVISAIMFMILSPGYFQLEGPAQQGSEKGHRALAEHFTEMFYSNLDSSIPQ